MLASPPAAHSVGLKTFCLNTGKNLATFFKRRPKTEIKTTPHPNASIPKPASIDVSDLEDAATFSHPLSFEPPEVIESSFILNHPHDPILAKLHPAVKRWLEFNENVGHDVSPVFPIGSKIEIGNQKATVLAFLGHGGEGHIFLVKVNQELKIAKVFYSPTQMTKNVSNMRILSGISANVPEVETVDLKRNTALLQYIEGIPMTDIDQNRQVLGLTQGDVNEINQQYLQEKHRLNGLGLTLIWKQNAVYSIKDKKVYFVDPH